MFEDSHYINREHSSKHSLLLHAHPDKAELYFVCSGSTRYMVGDYLYNLSEGDIVICNQGIMHGESFMDDHDDSSISVGIRNLYLENLPENWFCDADTKPVLHTRMISGQIRSIFQLLYTLSADIKNTREICDSMTGTLVLLICEFLRSRSRRRIQETVETSAEIFSREIRHAIDEKFRQDFSVSDFANLLNISESYVSHVFKDAYGLSPKQYLTERRLGEAQRLLQLTDLSVSTIGERSGFSSTSHFITIFTKYIGLSPGKYRQSLAEMDREDGQEE